MVKSGWNFILPFGIMGGVFLYQGFPVVGGICLALAIFCANFFRDPKRVIPTDPRFLVSPADGRVLAIEPVDDPYVGKALEIRVFLNVFNVHTQRSPFVVPAKIEGTRFFAGKFLAASIPKASLENEQHWFRLSSGKRKVVVKQIAGLIARRIIPWARPGDEVAGGQHVGLIQFGSQVDLVVPALLEALGQGGRQGHGRRNRDGPLRRKGRGAKA